MYKNYKDRVAMYENCGPPKMSNQPLCQSGAWIELKKQKEQANPHGYIGKYISLGQYRVSL